MSKTDKTKPHKFTDPHWCPYPCKHVSISKGLRWYTYKHERHFRAQLRADLAAGREPSTNQHRHSALWDAV